jgi:hypothetical protein
MNDKLMTVYEAWEHFNNVVVPLRSIEWSDKDRNRVAQANRDYSGKRVQKGKTVNLGPERIERILNELAPGLYLFEKNISVRLK